ncbi:MAG: roadblock/LC7 domain-containing protein [candidate division WOR-3 bacterium]
MKNFQALSKLPGVIGVGLVSEDGFIIDSQFSYGYDAERFGAMAAKIQQELKRLFADEEMKLLLYTHKITFLSKKTEDSVAFIVAERNTNVGLLRVNLDKI